MSRKKIHTIRVYPKMWAPIAGPTSSGIFNEHDPAASFPVELQFRLKIESLTELPRHNVVRNLAVKSLRAVPVRRVFALPEVRAEGKLELRVGRAESREELEPVD